MCNYRLYRFGCPHGSLYTLTQDCTDLVVQPAGVLIEPEFFCPFSSIPEPAVDADIPCWRCHSSAPEQGVDLEAYQAVIGALARDDRGSLSIEHQSYHARLRSEVPGPTGGYSDQEAASWSSHMARSPSPEQLMDSSPMLPSAQLPAQTPTTQSLVHPDPIGDALRMYHIPSLQELFPDIPIPTDQNEGYSSLPYEPSQVSDPLVQFGGSPLDDMLHNTQAVGHTNRSQQMLPNSPNQLMEPGVQAVRSPLDDMLLGTEPTGYTGSINGPSQILPNAGNMMFTDNGGYLGPTNNTSHTIPSGFSMTDLLFDGGRPGHEDFFWDGDLELESFAFGDSQDGSGSLLRNNPGEGYVTGDEEGRGGTKKRRRVG